MLARRCSAARADRELAIGRGAFALDGRAPARRCLRTSLRARAEARLERVELERRSLRSRLERVVFGTRRRGARAELVRGSAPSATGTVAASREPVNTAARSAASLRDRVRTRRAPYQVCDADAVVCDSQDRTVRVAVFGSVERCSRPKTLLGCAACDGPVPPPGRRAGPSSDNCGQLGQAKGAGDPHHPDGDFRGRQLGDRQDRLGRAARNRGQARPGAGRPRADPRDRRAARARGRVVQPRERASSTGSRPS